MIGDRQGASSTTTAERDNDDHLFERGRCSDVRTSTEPTTKVTVKRFPAFGVLLGALTLVVECWKIVGLIRIDGSFSLTDLLVALVALVALFGGLDFLLQIFLPGMGLALVPRAVLIIFVWFGFTHLIHVPTSFALLCVAAAWALAQIWCASLWGRFLPFRWVTLIPAAAIAVRLFFILIPAPPEAPAPPLSAEHASGPSFLVVVLDTVRADHLSAYGYGRSTSPALDRLAARGTRFERAYSTSSWTLPAHASLFTGLLPEEHGAHSEHLALSRDLPTLAGLLASSGYATAAFSGSPLVSAKTGMTRGFQHVEDFWKPMLVREALTGYRIFQWMWPMDRDKGGAELVTRAIEWMEERSPPRPYFMFVNLFEAHAPYQAVPVQFRRAFAPTGVSLHRLEVVGTLGTLAQLRGDPFPQKFHQHLTDLLDGAIAAADSYLSRLIDATEEDVVIIVLSDHGDLIGEHDHHGHGLVLWEPLIRIPMVMAGPGIPCEGVVAEPVSIIDVMPTVLAMANLSGPTLPGADLREVIAGERETERILYAQQFRNSSLIEVGWGRHHSLDAIKRLQSRKTAAISRTLKRLVTADGTDLTFDLALDPAERHPISAVGVKLPAHLPRPLARQKSRDRIDPGTEAAMRALGYIR
ncbi:sulfatase [bacterium]|nr:sulfatase [bacterium]